MHLLATQPGTVDDGAEAVDLGQTRGDIVVLSAADTELACLARAADDLGDGFPRVRLANLLRLRHNLSVDLYVESVIVHARLVVVHLLGGRSYWPYGLEQLADACRARDIVFLALPGDDRPEPEFEAMSSLQGAPYQRLWAYLRHGGIRNAGEFLRYAAALAGCAAGPWLEPAPLPNAGLYWPGEGQPDRDALEARWIGGGGRVPVLFYRALVQAGNTEAIDALISALVARGLDPVPVFLQGLRDPESAAILRDLLTQWPPSAVLNCTSFAVSAPGGARGMSPLDDTDCPVLQVILSGGSEVAWASGNQGVSPRDMAMNVALPEVDGRIISRAVAFKAETRFDARTQCPIVAHRPLADRVDFVADLALAWTRLAATPAPSRRVALILANYPNRDGRLGNGVGLDTPQSAVVILRAMADAGYDVPDVPASGTALMALLSRGPTNALPDRATREGGVFYPLTAYQAFFAGLPGSSQAEVASRWGAPESDPFFSERHGEPGFVLSVLMFGSVAVCVQPARGYNTDPAATYHDPDLVPPHNYLAFHAWLRHEYRAHAAVHLGKHGNLEWLPGKAVSLSAGCWPEAALGPMPNLYPFIVNDPGEGTQAKRRAGAVIIDHLTPPLTRAESYGALKDLEALVDEYYEASGMDPRRLKILRRDILDLAARSGLDKDCGAVGDGDEALAALDNYLCELKELQIRDGLHIFGRAPDGRQRVDLLVALMRTPRLDGKGANMSLLRAMAGDLGLAGFDPLDCVMGDPWFGPRPDILRALTAAPWRTCGDTVERLELLASGLVSGCPIPPEWNATTAVLGWLEQVLAPSVAACGEAELDGLLRGLDGRFVPPGPSGAPTRGRPDVLPTGRNFYSVDTRAVPTQAAWALGWKSAQMLVEDFRQREGAWPRAMAISAWGTSNMRTGGDDIAQALALMGVRPTWDDTTRKLTGFEIMPQTVLGRPRVDVTFRVSGFFRDAFGAQIDLLDSAARAVMNLDESDEANPLAACFRRDRDARVAAGQYPALAERRAGYRVFGSKPGAYGAGLQALIDEKIWDTQADLADAYLEWGAWAYGAGSEGVADRQGFETRLAAAEAVIQNQDNREHDLLDSDDYYQFEGGIAAAVSALRGGEPVIYHNDHSRPETPRIRTLADELGRIVRGRAANPKWIEGVMRHGFKGGFEMAATVDYLFGFAATTRAVKDHHFDQLFDAYLAEPAVLDFLRGHNPAALREMAERFREALDRHLWKPARNDTRLLLDHINGDIS
ncbi:cobaltochelatase subunit CobN [Iodidimonas sp. SYSU 1G8]|uniref:cobaltochelatase subunit CobN n=1 Tax=Iodidimonas sp. SYSU 1G8 TaxID=3133967 RepID=UPI0031FF3BA7